ncbi:MAG: amidohydrolase [Gammaproteobacteria bacterium]|nr:amidohydrolase [Gammaproteobacteria bacterium]
MMRKQNYIILLSLLALLQSCAVQKTSQAPAFADIHLHYNWDHSEYISAKEVVEKLQRNNVVLAVVSSVPSDFAVRLTAAAPEWIVAFYSPYYETGNRHNWYYDKGVLTATRKALETGKYAGLGEVHLVAGVGPRRDNPVFLGLIELAREFNVPMLLHTDASSYRYLLPICQQYPDLRILWAHAGGILPPAQLTLLLAECDNVWLDLAARDPWHYGGFVDDNGALDTTWKEFIIANQDKIMVGTDPVWNAHQMYRWYEADQGWNHYEQLLRYHHAWIDQLPASIQHKLRLTNAQTYFGLPGREID